MRITTFYHTEKIWGQKYDKIEILNYLTSQSDKIQNFSNDLIGCYWVTDLIAINLFHIKSDRLSLNFLTIGCNNFFIPIKRVFFYSFIGTISIIISINVYKSISF